MGKIIAVCGNDCGACPRHMPKTGGELRHTAELWYRVGYRDKVVPNEEILCRGCTAGNWCRYKIIDCAVRHGIENCGRCPEYQCAEIKAAFEQTMLFEPDCKRECSAEEYEIMKRAFFEKEKNLNEEAACAR